LSKGEGTAGLPGRAGDIGLHLSGMTEAVRQVYPWCPGSAGSYGSIVALRDWQRSAKNSLFGAPARGRNTSVQSRMGRSKLRS